MVVSFDIDRNEALKIVQDEVHALYADYELLIVPDVDVADL